MSELGFTRVTGKDQLLALAYNIKPDLPLSVSMYNHLLVHGRGHSHSAIYVLSNNPDSHAVMWLRKEQRTDASFFCRPQEVAQLTRALRETPLVDWSEFMFHNVPDYLVSPLQKVAEDLGGNSLRTWPYYSFTHHPLLDNEPLRCGPGLRVCRLGKAGVQQLLETNSSIQHDPLESMRCYIQNVPAVGLYLDPNVSENTLADLDDLPCAGDEELPVSWVTTTMCGNLGKLGTQKEYRRRGLGSLAMRVAARLQADQGYIPIACVAPSNSASLAMFRKMPEWSYNHHTVAWMGSASDIPYIPQKIT